MNRQNLVHLREPHASRPTKWLCSAVDETGDAWLLDPTDRLAARVTR
jgi:hypothetical protein